MSMPNPISTTPGRAQQFSAAELGTALVGRFAAELLFDTQQLVVLGHAIRTAQGAGLDLTGGGADGWKLLSVQAIIALCSMLVSAIGTAIIALILKAAMGWRVADEDEYNGIDLAEHRESAYELNTGFGSMTGLGLGDNHSGAHKGSTATKISTEGVN